MGNRETLLFSFLLLIFMIMSCAKPSSPDEGQAGVSIKRTEKAATADVREGMWETMLKEASKEGRVIVYTSSVASALKDAAGPFKDKFGLSLEIVAGRGGELTAKLLQERANGLFLADAFVSGTGSIFSAVKPSGAADPLEKILILTEVTDPKVWYGEKLRWGDDDRRIFSYFAYPSHQVGYNTDLVKPEEIKSYYDILDPRWRGKIIVNDPGVLGTASSGFSTFLLNKVLDLDFFRQLINQQIQLTRDQRLQVDWLARGKFSVAVWPRSVSMAEYQKAGAPLAYANPKEGTYLSTDGGNIVLVNKAPHPSAATIFINWLLSREGQIIMQRSLQQQSARTDIPLEGVDPQEARKPGGKYFTSAVSMEKWVLEQQDKDLELAKQLFGPLLK